MEATVAEQAAPQGRVLRKLYLALFLRGRGARGLKKDQVPKSVVRKLWTALFFYALIGLMALSMMMQPTLTQSIYLHTMTMVFLGMFVASTSGEVLFSESEADILMHRPVEPRAMLWAKVAVLLQVSLWLAGAFNLAGMLGGVRMARIGWGYVPVHAFSTAMMALFCTSGVVMVYQLCLRWFGREKLNGVMTTAQVLVAIGAVLGGQLVPQMLPMMGKLEIGAKNWWVGLMPPVWFAGIDDALAGSGANLSWLLALVALVMTAGVVIGAFGKLAQTYEEGLQKLNERTGKVAKGGGGVRWVEKLAGMPPIRWWLRDRVARASFVLVGAYLLRDRDVKLRVYPGIAPILVMPLIFLMQDMRHGNGHGGSGFGLAFAVAYTAMIPLMGLNLLQYSQQWQAADVFRMAPLAGPGRIMDGARRAAVLFLGVPMVVGLGVLMVCVRWGTGDWVLMIPGILAMPVFARAGQLRGAGMPLSMPTDAAKGTSRGLGMLVAMLAALGIAAAALGARYMGWYWTMVGVEAVVMGVLYAGLRWWGTRRRWESVE